MLTWLSCSTTCAAIAIRPSCWMRQSLLSLQRSHQNVTCLLWASHLRHSISRSPFLQLHQTALQPMCRLQSYACRCAFSSSLAAAANCPRHLTCTALAMGWAGRPCLPILPQTTQALLDQLENELVKSAASSDGDGDDHHGSSSGGHDGHGSKKKAAAACAAAHAVAASTGGHGAQPQIMLQQVPACEHGLRCLSMQDWNPAACVSAHLPIRQCSLCVGWCQFAGPPVP